MLDTLERWGVRDFRMLALLPEHALAARLGEAGARLQRLSRGASMRTLALCEPGARFEEALELESAVETLEPLSFLLNRALEQLCARLEARALAVQELTLRLQLDPRVSDEQAITLEELASTHYTTSEALEITEAQKTKRNLMKETPCPPCLRGESFSTERSNLYARTLRLPVAMRDPKVFLKLLQLDLAAHPPGAPICKLWIAAEPARPRSAQRGLFLPVTPEAERLEITLARITGVVGERRAGIAKLLDTHRPDAFQVERFISQQEPDNGNRGLTLSDTASIPPLALRLFRPPRQIRVQVTDGRPCRLAMLTADAGHSELEGKILWSAGPWRSSGDWWAERSASPKTNSEEAHVWDREEWDIALANDGGSSVALYRIYRDTGTRQWFADASYD
jgi:protein ImuB